MNVKVSWNNGNDVNEADLASTESDVWKFVGSSLIDVPVPNKVDVETPMGDASLEVKQRGTFDRNGQKMPSMYVVPIFNNIQLSPSMYDEAYLTCINPGSNNYKYYWLRPNNAGNTISVGARYGRIGSNPGDLFGTKDLQTPYEPYLYWIRYYEKLSKGYVDQTDVYLKSSEIKQTKPTTATNSQAPTTPGEILFSILQAHARKVVQTTLVNQNITSKQVSESKKIWKKLGERKTVKGFNDQLMKLMTLSPRRVAGGPGSDGVQGWLAKGVTDFATIIDREESLINAMEGSMATNPTRKTAKRADSFEDYDVEVYEATPEQKQQVMKRLNSQLQQNVKQIWRVIPKKQKERFDRYLQKNHIEKVKQFWHGSKNENWFSIAKNSLSLNPNASITGKMFGNGIYFSPTSMKSWGYTSFHGTYWANGKSNTAFMGLYATAYGKPYDATNDIRHYTSDDLKRLGCNCVHAKAGSYLRNDEVVFYDEDAVLLNYIVEFEG